MDSTNHKDMDLTNAGELPRSISSGSLSIVPGIHQCHCGKECTRSVHICHSLLYLKIKYLNIICSASGLTRHQSKCSEAPITTGTSTLRAMVFPCPLCSRNFGQKRYLDKHMGGKKCEQRKAFLEKTASFSLALTGSPSSVHSSYTSTGTGFSSEEVICKNLDICTKIQLSRFLNS